MGLYRRREQFEREPGERHGAPGNVPALGPHQDGRPHHGDSRTWTGKANVILDNLIADGKAKPMIVVMPYGHVPREIKSAPNTPAPTNDPLAIEKELMTAVRPLVESKYRVLTDRKQRAIAGLSMGAGQSLSIGLHNLDHFAYIGAFSGGPNRNEWDRMDPNILNQKLKVLWIGSGREDKTVSF